jgi:hypothetical protein
MLKKLIFRVMKGQKQGLIDDVKNRAPSIFASCAANLQHQMHGLKQIDRVAPSPTDNLEALIFVSTSPSVHLPQS